MHANFAEMLESENVGSPSEEQLLRGGKKPNNFTNNFSNGRSGSAMEKYSQTQQDCQFLQLECARLRKYLYGLTAVVVAGVLILVITISVLFGKLSHDLVNHSHQPKVGEQISKILETEELCIPCDSVRLGPSVEEDKMLDTFIRRQTEQSGEECCVEKPKQLLALLELFVEKRLLEEMAGGTIRPAHQSTSNRNITYAAHLMGYNRKIQQPGIPGNQFSIPNWIHEEDLAFTNGVQYRNGRLVVPEDGLYYVYSHVSFEENFGHGSSGSRSVSNSLSHYLYRYNIIYPNGGEELLIMNSLTKCWDENKQFGEYSSYLGALFKLRRRDELLVKVSNLTTIVTNHKINSFGFFRVGDFL